MSETVHPALGRAMQEPVHGAQAAFRVLLQGFAAPGRVHALPLRALAGIEPPPCDSGIPLGLGVTALLLTLLDRETTLALHGACDGDAVRRYLRFHTGVRTVAPGAAAFEVLPAADLTWPRCETFACGSDAVPQQGATVIVTLPGFEPRPGAPLLRLQGPGIAHEQALALPGVPREALAWRQALQAEYPRGVELVFVAGDRLAVLPRSTRLVEIG